MKIIDRYILREHVGPFVFSLTALTSLLLLQYIARRFGDLVGKGLGWQVIAEFFVLSVPFTVAMTLPMAVLVAVLYAFSRLAAENEVTALKAGGVSTRKLMAPVLATSVLLSLVVLGFNDQILPRANHRLAVLQFDIFRTKPTFALRSQVINTVKEGQLYLRAGHIDEATAHMRDVVIYDLADPTRRRTIYADSGYLALAPNERDLYLTLFHGVIQSVTSGKSGELTRLFYEQDLLRVRDVASQFQQTSPDASTSKGDREMSICEMQTEFVRNQRAREYAEFQVRDAEREIRLAGGETAGVADESAEAPEGPLTRQPRNLGRLYCALLNALPKVKEASASPVPSQEAAAIQVEYSMEVEEAQRRLVDAQLRADAAKRKQNRFDLEIHKKFSLAAACFVFVLVGAPIALRFPRGGVGVVIGVSFVVFALYYVTLIGGESLADNGLLSPVWAMWAANLIFAVVGLALLVRMGSEATTTRGGDFAEMLDTARVWTARQGRRVGLGLDRRRRT